MKRLVIFFLSLCLCLAFLPALLTPPINAQGENWLSGWIYRKSHLITNSTNADINYQVRFMVFYGSGSDSGMNVYTSSHCLSTFDDIRWTSSDGSTLLDYWMENSTASSNATFWVEVSANLTSTNQTIHIYYGNTSACSSLSNFDNTFIFGEPFSSSTLDSAKWNSTGSPTYTISTTGHYVEFTGATNWGGSDGFHSKNNPNIPSSNWIMESAYGEKKGQYSYVTTSASAQLCISTLNFHTTWAYASATNGLLFVTSGDYWTGFQHVTWATGHNNTNDFASVELSQATISLYSLWWSQPNAYSQINCSTTNPPTDKRGNSTLSSSIAIVNIGVSKHPSYASGTTREGAFKVRRFVQPEPPHSTWGIEVGAPFYDLTKVGNTSNETVSTSTFFSFWYCLSVDLSGYIFSWNISGSYVNDTWTAFSSTNNSWANVSKLIDIAVGNNVSVIVYANSSVNVWNTLPVQTYTITATVLFYFNEYGQLGRNTTLLPNGTSTTYDTLTPHLDLEALANSTYTYLNITWTYGSTTENSYVFTVVNATTIWIQFGLAGAGVPPTTYNYTIARFEFTPSNPTPNSTILFNASQSYSTVAIINYTWNFGDSNITTIVSDTITHSYSANNTYVVSLSVGTSAENNSAFVFHTVDVYEITGGGSSDEYIVFLGGGLVLGIVAIVVALAISRRR